MSKIRCFLLAAIAIMALARPAYPQWRYTGFTADSVTPGSGPPSSGTCSNINHIKRIYAQKDAEAAQSTLWICAQTAPGVFQWEKPGGGSGTVGPGTVGKIAKFATATSVNDSAITEDSDSINFSKPIEVGGSGSPDIFKNIAAPGSNPASGFTNVYVDSTTKKLATRDDAGTITNYTAGGTSLPSPGTGWAYSKNFFNCVNSGTDLTINQSLTGGGLANITPPPTANWVGGCQLNTSTSTTGQAAVRFQTSGGVSRFILFGGGAWSMSWYVRSDANLSDGTNTYRIHVGFMESYGSATPTDGVFFRYTDSVNSGKWQCVHVNNSTETVADSGVTFAINTNYKLAYTVNAAGTATTFAINGTPVCGGMAQTNIPASAGREVGLGAMILKSAGTTQRNLNLLGFEVSHTYTTAW